ncbi:endochitinase-like [Halictus rubicundus]|uniref:endochitinase-like n=1 Tax=Halictus rubicundus TaxID=77578 RepID=UPI004036E5B3
MELAVAIYSTCLMVVLVAAGVPLPRIGESQTYLADNCQIPKCPEEKREDQERAVLLPYPMDCFQYVECAGSIARILPCPPDEVFDKKTSTCGHRDKVRCVPCYEEAPLE